MSKKPHGKGVFIQADGVIYLGYFKDGKLADGRITVQWFKDLKYKCKPYMEDAYVYVRQMASLK